MASKTHDELKHAGFSVDFLRSPAGTHPTVRAAIKINPAAWRTCQNCKNRYCDLSKIKSDLKDAKGHDLKRHVTGAHKAGFCSWPCASRVFGGEKAARLAVKAYFVALRPDFYETREWRELRYAVLAERGGRCECCGRTAKHGVVIHVDHIKPRSKYPHLALTKENMQILCADCNIGKGAAHETDWRGVANG